VSNAFRVLVCNYVHIVSYQRKSHYHDLSKPLTVTPTPKIYCQFTLTRLVQVYIQEVTHLAYHSKPTYQLTSLTATCHMHILRPELSIRLIPVLGNHAYSIFSEYAAYTTYRNSPCMRYNHSVRTRYRQGVEAIRKSMSTEGACMIYDCKMQFLRKTVPSQCR